MANNFPTKVMIAIRLLRYLLRPTALRAPLGVKSLTRTKIFIITMTVFINLIININTAYSKAPKESLYAFVDAAT